MEPEFGPHEEGCGSVLEEDGVVVCAAGLRVIPWAAGESYGIAFEPLLCCWHHKGTVALERILSWQKSNPTRDHPTTEAVLYHYQDSDCVNRYKDLSHRGTEYDLHPSDSRLQ